MASNPSIVPESAGHADAVIELNRRAFGREEEAALVLRLRNLGDQQISLVATLGNDVVGHILFTPVHIAESPTLFAYGLGPMSVLPEHQKQGIGGQLIKAGLDACRERGIEAVFVLGHAEYYPKFGFQPASQHEFHYEDLKFDPHFFVQELAQGSLSGKSGWIQYDPAFNEV